MFRITGDGDIYLTRGDTAKIDFDIRDGDGDAYTLTGTDVLTFTVKADTATSTETLQKTLSPGYTLPRITLAPADTSSLAYGEYVYDVQVVLTGGETFTPVGPYKFILTEEVTF